MRKLLVILFLSCGFTGCRADQAPSSPLKSTGDVKQVQQEFVVIPNSTNAVQFRLYTNASPDSAHLPNTFDVLAHGETLLQSPESDALKSRTAFSANAHFHNILIAGKGPEMALANNLTVIEQTSGPGWSYLAVDASAPYRDRLKEYRRSILFVEPDLFVLHDHVVAGEPVTFQMLLHPPAATRVDELWRDLRLDLPKAGFQIQSPGEKRMLRSWERIDSACDAVLPGTVTMQLGPTNKIGRLDLITVFAVFRGGEKEDYAFKLLESNNAVGARIHRDGLPTLVAFRIDPQAATSSLTGFPFNGPVGVDVFRPKRK